MLTLITSPSAVIYGAGLNAGLIQALIRFRAQGHRVGIVSNHVKPAWFDEAFKDSGVAFIKTDARQNGQVIHNTAKNLKIPTHDILVLAATQDDMRMAKNGSAVLIAAGWSNDAVVQNLGIKVASPDELEELIQLTNGWSGHWWFEGDNQKYRVRALIDLSQYGKDASQQLFAGKLTNTVKNGGVRLTAVLTITARSLLIDGVDGMEDLFWAVYPSSKSANDDSEVLSEFTHRLRTTVSRVRLGRVGEPLFIRHTASDKRSANKTANRTDPTNQVTTLHLNPVYRAQIRRRNVIIVDDCTTYGISFAVASAFLHAAGAASVSGIALGKFGNQLGYHDIVINSDPFQPVGSDQFQLRSQLVLSGKTDGTAQQTLLALIP
jgi:hypothetical protein